MKAYLWRTLRKCRYHRSLLIGVFLLFLLLLFFLSILRSPRSTARGIAIIHGDGFLDDYLHHVMRVLSLVGYEIRRGYRKAASPAQTDADWNILWSHVYPFIDMPELKNIRKHQKVNKLPGMGYITNKASTFGCAVCVG